MITDDLPAALDRLVALGQNRDVNIRPVLLRVLVDMFVTKPTHASQDLLQFEEIASRLLDEADPAARLIVADKLAHHPLTPKRLLKRFVADRGAVAATVLAHGSLDPSSLQAAAAFGNVEMAVAVAHRADLTPSIVQSLAERPEPEIVLALADNAAVTLDLSTQRYLIRRGREDESLAAALLQRPIDPVETSPLFLHATRAQRREILAAVRRQDLGLTIRPEPVPNAREALLQIERSVRLPSLEGLDIALCRALGFSQADVDHVLDDPDGEPLAVALAALGATPDLAARIFILGNPVIGHAYQAVRRLVDIVDTLSTRAARRLTGAITGVAPPSAPSQQLLDRAVDRSRRAHEMRDATAAAKAGRVEVAEIKKVG